MRIRMRLGLLKEPANACEGKDHFKPEDQMVAVDPEGGDGRGQAGMGRGVEGPLRLVCGGGRVGAGAWGPRARGPASGGARAWGPVHTGPASGGVGAWGGRRMGAAGALGLAKLSRKPPAPSNILGTSRGCGVISLLFFLSSSSSGSPVGKLPRFLITPARSAGPAAALKTACASQPSPNTTSSGKPSLALFSRALGSCRQTLSAFFPTLVSMCSWAREGRTGICFCLP